MLLQWNVVQLLIVHQHIKRTVFFFATITAQIWSNRRAEKVTHQDSDSENNSENEKKKSPGVYLKFPSPCLKELACLNFLGKTGEYKKLLALYLAVFPFWRENTLSSPCLRGWILYLTLCLCRSMKCIPNLDLHPHFTLQEQQEQWDTELE